MGEQNRDRVLAVVQARMSSSRLPGKVLADIAGEPLLSLLLARLKQAGQVDDVVVATSVEPGDDAIADLCSQQDVRFHRGSLEDVLGRFVGAIGEHTGPVVRVTADCPLLDPTLVDATVMALAGSPDAVYASNIEPRTFPDGLDVEVVTALALREIDQELDSAELREHVTLAIRRDPQRWPRVAVTHEPDIGLLRWTVDTQDDLEFVRNVVARLGTRRYEAGLDEILETVRRAPSLEAGGLRG